MSSKSNKKGNKRASASSKQQDEEMSFSEQSEEENDINMEAVKNINVEFEAVTPQENDFHGIKQLLLRTFIMLHIDISDMSNLIISQSHIGSTMKIVDDEDDEVYGLVTLLNMTKYKEKTCIKDLKKGLHEKCKSSGKDVLDAFDNIINNKKVGYLINERFLNLPDQIAFPFHSSLKNEMEEAIQQDSMYDFDYLLLIAKTLRPTKAPIKSGAGESSAAKNNSKKKKTKHMQPLRNENETDYANFEDEFFHEVAEISFSYNITQATGFAVAGGWDFVDQPMNSYRTVCLIPKTKWKNVLLKIENNGS